MQNQPKDPISLPTDNNTIRKGSVEAQERKSGNPERTEEEQKDDQRVSSAQEQEQTADRGVNIEDVPESTNKSEGNIG